MTESKPKIFADFYSARDYAAKNVKGLPGWRITEIKEGFVIELQPGCDTRQVIYLQEN